MAKDPAFLFYSQDWIVGCQTLTMHERGQYITILAQMHQQGRMKEETICLLVGSVSDNLRAKFRITDDGFWYNERLEIESEKRSKYLNSRRENGLKGGRPTGKKLSKKPNNNHMAIHMEDENEDENEVKVKRGKKLFIPPTLEEVMAYFKQNGYLEEVGRKAHMGYSEAGWKDSYGKPVLNWKQKMINVWFREEHKIPSTLRPMVR